MLRSPIAPTRFAMATVPLMIGAMLIISGCIRQEGPATAEPADTTARADSGPPSKHDTAVEGSRTLSPEGNRANTASAPDSGVANAKPVLFHVEEPWASQGANVRVNLAFDQPITQQAGATPGDKSTTVYAGPKDYAKLTIYLHCTQDVRASDAHGPLGLLESVQVFSAGGAKPMAVYTREQLSYTLTDEPGTGPDAKSARVEHVRIPFWEHGALVRDGHPYAFTVVVLDKAGKTMAVQDVTGDEAVDPIAPWQR